MSPTLPRPLLGTDTSADHRHQPRTQQRCSPSPKALPAWLMVSLLWLWPQQGGGWPRQPAPSLAPLSFPSHPFPSSLPSCVPHFLAFCAAWESSRIFSAVAQPTSKGKGWMTKPNPSSEPTVSRRAAGSWAPPVPHPSSLLPPSAPSKSLHTAQVCRMPCMKSSGCPTGGFYLGRGQRCQWKLSCRRGARQQRRRRRPESPRSRPALFSAPFLFALAAAQSGAAASSGRAGWRAASTAAPAPRGHPRRLYLRNGGETRPRSR